MFFTDMTSPSPPIDDLSLELGRAAPGGRQFLVVCDLLYVTLVRRTVQRTSDLVCDT